jgi:4-amino-4-deoxy-L-arabinose transferase-like glycosyltransferase
MKDGRRRRSPAKASRKSSRASAAPLRPPLESWLARHPRIVVAALIAVCAAVRVTCFVQLNSTPLVEAQKWQQTDMHYYDEWARAIAAGDWLSATVHVPMHRWHHDVARRYFDSHPETRAALERDPTSGASLDPDERLWRRWMRVPQFYQDPLYAYLIAITYRIAGTDVRAVLAWQLAAGIGTCVLIWLIARRYFGDFVAAWAAALALLSGPLVFYELLLLRDSLIVFAGLLLVWLTDRAFTRERWLLFGALGLAVGFSCLLKSTFVLFGLAVVAAVLTRARGDLRRRIVSLAGFAGGVAIAFSPLVTRNIELGVPPFAMASSGGLTFVASNSPTYLPDIGFGIDAQAIAQDMGDADGRQLAAVLGTLQRHTGPSYVRLLWRKWDRLWHWYEIPNNENFYYIRTQVPLLAWLPVTFWVCSPLALAGLFLAARRGQDVWPLYLLVSVTAASMIVFYVLARFRIALVAAVIPFAAVTLVELANQVRSRRYARCVALALCIVALNAWTGRPLAERQVLIRMTDWILPYSVFYQTKVYDALDNRDFAGAAGWYLEFFDRYEPDEGQIASGDPSLGPELADMHRECAGILKAAGQSSLADAQTARAERILRLRALR